MFKKKLFTKVEDIICFDTNDPIAAKVKNFYRKLMKAIVFLFINTF
jgi:hypothetical protein